jgi:hypothetical protein
MTFRSKMKPLYLTPMKYPQTKIKVKRTWTNPETGEVIPVREAPGDLKVQPLPEDIDGAVPFDAENCAYARCLKRIFNSTMAWCGRRFAYVLTLDEKGAKVLEHYEIREAARAYLDAFDHGKKIEPAGFVFHKPMKSNELEQQREEAQKRRNARKQNGDSGKPPALKGPPQIALAPASPGKRPSPARFRYGSGLVHFSLGTSEKGKANITFLKPKRLSPA